MYSYITYYINCIVISDFQAKLYPVSFSFSLAKLNKSHRKNKLPIRNNTKSES